MMDLYVQKKRNETEYWGEEWKKENHVIRCLGVYVFAPSIKVHCCEITPSYELWPVRNEFEFEPGTSQDDIEKAEEDAMSAESGIIYIHCSSLNLEETQEIGECEDVEEAVESADANWI